VLLGLRLNKVAPQAGQDRLGLCERQSHRRRRAAGRGAAASVHLMHVLGTSTSAIDRAWKLEEYFRLPSMRQYLIVWADRQQGAHHRRTDQVSIETVTVMSGSARLGPPGIEIQVEDICAP
jgi:hypothetical protein